MQLCLTICGFLQLPTFFFLTLPLELDFHIQILHLTFWTMAIRGQVGSTLPFSIHLFYFYKCMYICQLKLIVLYLVQLRTLWYFCWSGLSVFPSIKIETFSSVVRAMQVNKKWWDKDTYQVFEFSDSGLFILCRFYIVPIVLVNH